MRIASTGVCKSILKALKKLFYSFFTITEINFFHIKLVVKKVFSAGHFNFSHLHIHGYNIIALKNHLLVGFMLHKSHLYNVLKSEWFCAIIQKKVKTKENLLLSFRLWSTIIDFRATVRGIDRRCVALYWIVSSICGTRRGSML